MKIGNKVRVYNTDGTYDVAKLVCLSEETASIKYKNIPGVFTYCRTLIKPLRGK